MSDSRDLLSELTCKGVTLFVADGKLRWRAAPGVMTIDALRALKRQERQIAAVLAADPAAGEPLLRHKETP